MGFIVKWSLIVIVGAVLFAGLATAAAITHTIFSTGGMATGLLIGGVPDAANGLRQGVAAAQAHVPGSNRGPGGVTAGSWSGGTLYNWTGGGTAAAPTQPQQPLPAAQRRAAAVHHHRHHHPKPNA